MKKGLSDLMSSKRKSCLGAMFTVVLLAVFYLHYQLGFILEPSSFDMILELTVLKLVPILKPSIEISNYRPQLGQMTFLLTGESGKLFGIAGSYVIRYILFSLNIVVLLYVFKEFSENKKLNCKNGIFFLMTTGLTFFAMVKYFYVVDFLTALPFAFLSLLAILQNRSKVMVFIFVALGIYFKFSILLFLFPLLLIGQSDYRKLFSYKLPIILATVLGLGMFFIKSVEHVLGQRGLFTILKYEGILNFMTINIFAPWKFFYFFDQSTANYSLAWSPYIIVKVLLLAALGIFIFTKYKTIAVVDFLCVVVSFIGIIAIQPNLPWFHDIGFYIGLIGLFGMIIAWKYQTILFTRKCGIVIIALFIGDFYYWNQSLKSVGLVTTKFKLQEDLKHEIAANKVTDLYLYCRNNIGEFEWNLRDQPNLKIHYIVDAPGIAENAERLVSSKSLWLFPKKCLHENPPQNIGEGPSLSATLKKELYLNSMEHYKLYSNY